MTDSRTCHVCHVRGMVHLDREPEEGPTVNPVVECPMCGQTWIARGPYYFFKVTDDTTDEELETVVEQIRAHAALQEGRPRPVVDEKARRPRGTSSSSND